MLFEDRATQHTCPASWWMTAACSIEVRMLAALSRWRRKAIRLSYGYDWRVARSGADL